MYIKEMNSPRSPHNNLSSELKNIITHKNALSMKSRMKVLNALNEDDVRNRAEREKRLRLQAIQEILTTEVTYLQQLEILMEFFLQPIIEKKLVNHIILNTLLENIKTLYNISGELIKELKQDTENISGAFYKLAPFFKLYSVYAYDYEQVSTLLQVTQEKDPSFKNFISKQETRPEVGKSLFSLLITPIQRVPRYKLLLKEVLQHTPNKHKEYNLLQACLVEVEKAAVHINNLVAENEDIQRLLMLQKCIVNGVNLVKPGRKLIKQGTLMRVSRNGDTAYRRYFVLLNDTLLYCKGKPESSLTVRCVLPLNKCKVESVLSGGLFRVTCLEEMLFLYSENGDSNSWIQLLQKAIEKYTECRQTLRKDSSSRQPLRHKNINLFPSEDLQERYIKRKRTKDTKDVQLNPSNIMYFEKENQENEMEEQQENCFRLNRKLKRFKNDISAGIPMDKDTSEICFMESSDMSVSYLNNSDSIHYLSLVFKNICEFFSYVSSSIQNIFRYR
ncbi:FYVE, RhoGEF and PH domain-containing protein 4-like [Vespa mandarinia]|uniref:FYVE, RhoGEF and PH domain-containing protein 4-like n=1 Tax=Vespa mandarinia TaxID=7446 RepID=UPI001614854A|nr:FYVE, RhoGEF and PH domain-containing protein 4-like [Vespa mandarinia]